MRALRAGLHRLGIELSRYPGATPLAVHLKALLDELEVDCVLDVGAHRGEYGKFLRAIGYRGAIVSFEPNPGEYALLERAAARDVLWEAREIALGSARGKGALNVAASTDLASFLEPSPAGTHHFGPGIAAVSSVPVEVETVADVLDARGPGRVLLKSDTQGFDLEVIRGAGSRLRDLAGVQAEVAVVPPYVGAPDLLDVLGYMRGHGFCLTGIFPVTADRATAALLEVDCVWRRLATP